MSCRSAVRDERCVRSPDSRSSQRTDVVVFGFVRYGHCKYLKRRHRVPRNSLKSSTVSS